MALTLAVTTILGIAIGRYINVLGLVLTTIVALILTAIVLFHSYEGMTYWILLAANVAVYEVAAVCAMVFLSPRQDSSRSSLSLKGIGDAPPPKSPPQAP
jgi:hypothetical protein